MKGFQKKSWQWPTAWCHMFLAVLPSLPHKIATCLIGVDTSALLVWLFLCLANSGQQALSCTLSFTILDMLSVRMIMNVMLRHKGLLKSNVCRQKVLWLEVQQSVKQSQPDDHHTSVWSCPKLHSSDSFLLNLSLTFFLSFCQLLHREAEGFKEQGNAFYIKKDYAEAFNYYTKAIGNYPYIIVFLLVDGMMLISCLDKKYKFEFCLSLIGYQ